MTEPRTRSDQGRPAPGDVGSLTDLTDDVLPALVARLRASRLGELEVRRGDWRVRLRREAISAAAHERPEEPSAPAERFAAERTDGLARSPGVGYFGLIAGIGVGSEVRSGDPVGWVDVLGIRQEVSSPFDGVVGRFLAEAGEAVEYGQPLARIESDMSPDEVAPGPGPVEAGGRAAD